MKGRLTFSLAVAIAIMGGGMVFSGPFNCENEMAVNTVFGNRVPLTEDNAKRAGWTKMSDILGASFHSPALSLLMGKLSYPAVASGVELANMKNWLLSKLNGQTWDKSHRIDAGDVIDAMWGINHKYISKDGKHEAVYDPKTGELINQGRYMGTYNKDDPTSFFQVLDHFTSSIKPHVECVLNGDYMWDPTTQCFVVTKDGKESDVDCETKKPISQPSPQQSYTIDNRQMKQWASQQLEGAYQYASGIAAEAGVGAEYQSAVAPVMSQGRSAINSIPDQQTVTVPTQVQPQ